MKYLKKTGFIGLILFFYLSGKSQDFASGNQPEIQGNIIEENTLGYYSQAFGYNISMMSNHLLYETVASWLGTPYRYSGKSFTGIDCSGFVNMLYNKVFNIPLTGSAAELFNRVNLLKKNDLKEGDLVFFKIRKRRISHVGIYLGENKFAHASTHNGVIISDLNEPYYKKYFVKGGKVKSTF